jgi:hypothetical protein
MPPFYEDGQFRATKYAALQTQFGNQEPRKIFERSLPDLPTFRFAFRPPLNGRSSPPWKTLITDFLVSGLPDSFFIP